MKEINGKTRTKGLGPRAKELWTISGNPCTWDERTRDERTREPRNCATWD